MIADLRRVVIRLSALYDLEERRLWLYASHPMLNGERAIDLINRGSTENVFAVIQALTSGAYT